jgi:hypothetical protein
MFKLGSSAIYVCVVAPQQAHVPAVPLRCQAARHATGVVHGRRPAQERRQWRCRRREGGEVGLPLRSPSAKPFWPKLRVIAAGFDFGIRRHRRSLSKIEVSLIFSMPNSLLPLSSPSHPAVGAHRHGTRMLPTCSAAIVSARCAAAERPRPSREHLQLQVDALMLLGSRAQSEARRSAATSHAPAACTTEKEKKRKEKNERRQRKGWKREF